MMLSSIHNSAEGAGLRITSPAFRHETMIPAVYTCQGRDVNPPLEISGIPQGTRSLVLIMDDPDAPGGTWVHWVVYDIPPVASIAEDSVPGKEAGNSFGRVAYGGPCPPSGTHRYFFKLYALDVPRIEVPAEGLRLRKLDVERAMRGHILDRAELIGLYRKH